MWEVFPDDDPPRKKIPKRAPTFLIHRSLTSISLSPKNIGGEISPHFRSKILTLHFPHILVSVVPFCG